MQCNIDARGRVARLISGLVVSAAGLVMLVLVLMQLIAGRFGYPAAAALLALGAFQVFEARTGWCVVRAMGFKTPM